MTPEEVLVAMSTAGVTLSVHGDTLVAKPTERVTPAIVATLKEHKPQIIEVLAGTDSAMVESVPEPELEPISPKQAARAEAMGMAACWSREFGYVSLHDPTDGSWHDVPIKSAPEWALSEARARKTLWKMGDTRAYHYSGCEMEQRWKDELPPVPFEREHGRPGDRRAGLIYDDEIEEE